MEWSRPASPGEANSSALFGRNRAAWRSTSLVPVNEADRPHVHANR